MGPSSFLLWSSCLLLTVFSPPSVVAKTFWCPPDTQLGGCPASDANTMLKITVNDPGVNTCEEPLGTQLPCDDDQFASNPLIQEILDIKNADTCQKACNSDTEPILDDDHCKAYTYVTNREGKKHDLCFLLKNCDGAGINPPIDPDEPCHADNKCSGGYVCDKTDCSSDPALCTGTLYCSQDGYCKEKGPCDTPTSLDHDYSEPEKRHWGPCLNSDFVDNECNVYLPGKKCQDKTVCTQPKCGDDGEVKHTCDKGTWMRTVGTGTTEPVTDQSVWEETVCKACQKLTIFKEPGLSLFCKSDKEPEEDVFNIAYKIEEGPCALYCNGILIHHIHCDTTTTKWTGDEGITGPFYCWNKPSG